MRGQGSYRGQYESPASEFLLFMLPIAGLLIWVLELGKLGRFGTKPAAKLNAMGTWMKALIYVGICLLSAAIVALLHALLVR